MSIKQKLRTWLGIQKQAERMNDAMLRIGKIESKLRMHADNSLRYDQVQRIQKRRRKGNAAA